MSRLDDELRIAFKRKDPSADFAARVLERINETPAPKITWWKRLAELFEPPKLRWVAIGVAASLLVAIGAAQYYRLHETSVEQGASLAQTGGASEPSDAGTKKDESSPAPIVVAAPDEVGGNERRLKVAPPRRQLIKRDAAPRSALNQARLARAPKEQPVSAEAEAAKEQVLFALQIVDSTLTDAQRVIQEDNRKSKPEPRHNR